MATHNDQIVKHLISATEHLLRQKPKAQFINDSPSVIVSGGESLSAEALAALSYTCVQSQVDVIYVEFEPGLPELGPENVIVMGERDGALYRWSDCALWSPPSGEPLLIMPRGNKICFAYDGLALISIAKRPTRDIRKGVTRASERIRQALRTRSGNSQSQAGPPVTGAA